MVDAGSRERRPANGRPGVHQALALAFCVLFLASVARFYEPGLGFTALLGLTQDASETPALRAVPHYEYPRWASYDGRFYVQRALDPLVRDPQVDRAMDLAPFRARRILFSWTAYVVGLGRPAWIVEAFALQNVAAWLVLAVLLARWLPIRSWRHLALWTGCMFSHGLLWSVRFALIDGPSLLLIAFSVLLVERGRPLVSAIVAGVSGLGRETNVIAILAQPVPATLRGLGRLLAAGALVLLPLLIWMDYLRSIYRSTLLAGADQLTLPGVAPIVVMRRVFGTVASSGLWSVAGLELCIVLPLAIQAIYIAAHPRVQRPWWRIAAGYVLLMLVMNPVLWDPATGASTRVLLPMTIGFNVMLAGEARSRFWAWFALGNLHLIAAVRVMPVIPGL